eukprot:TRINITY_DN249_c0_g1_i5.p1 TRINITY_DN249_c0_g1~~TRINITY_DN249_c0_g1_i5.p1  ORF type:complete len:473 (-),score=72.21 TRINITY_DN249_c0_g1_i5:581-1999(-)
MIFSACCLSNTLRCVVTVPGGAVQIAQASVPAPASPVERRVHIDVPLRFNPARDLWSPRGYGGQPLCELLVRLLCRDGTEVSHMTQQIGLRQLTFEHHADGAVYFTVNGKRIFVKGADWIPLDLFAGRVTAARERATVDSAAMANMNFLRVWGGGIYESDDFYDACDRLGVLVWQDFMFSCSCYPASEPFLSSVAREVQHQVRRLCSHPCVCLWCGNNECEEGMPFDCPPLLERHMDDYLTLFAKTIPPIVKDADPSRTYWRSSPSRGIVDGPFDKSSGNVSEGDCHYWGVWHGGLDFRKYLTIRPRMCTEFGFQSLPYQLLEGYVSLYGLRSATVTYRQRSAHGNDKLLQTIDQFFGPAVAASVDAKASFEREVYLTQVYQAWAIKTAAEHMRRLMPYCAGISFWQLNDVWPGPSWSSLEYNGQWKMLQYYAKNFYADTLVPARVLYVLQHRWPIPRRSPVKKQQACFTCT